MDSLDKKNFPPTHSDVLHAIRIMILLIAIAGVGMRACDTHKTQPHHECCDHHHDHDDEAPDPDHQGCDGHDHHCSLCQHIFSLPHTNRVWSAHNPPSRAGITAWNQRIPDGPCMEQDIPPVIV